MKCLHAILSYVYFEKEMSFATFENPLHCIFHIFNPEHIIDVRIFNSLIHNFVFPQNNV